MMMASNLGFLAPFRRYSGRPSRLPPCRSGEDERRDDHGRRDGGLRISGLRGLPGMSSQGGTRADESAPEIRDQEVDLDGSRVHYLTAGDGPHLVLHHGLGDSARDWQ